MKRKSKKSNSDNNKNNKNNIDTDTKQINLADAWNLDEDTKKEFLRPTNRNHYSDPFDFIDFDDELKKIKKKDLDDYLKLRSEQIHINDPYYNKIFSILCNYSKRIYNSSIYQIKQVMKKNFDYNYKYDNKGNEIRKDIVSKEEKELRLKIYGILNKGKINEDNIFIREKGYQHEIYNLLDEFFRNTNNENYISIPQQTSQQSIKLACDALYSNEQSKINYQYHKWDYTGEPGDVGYKKDKESISILTNQQCKIEIKKKYIDGRGKKIKSPYSSKIRKGSKGVNRFCLSFPKDLRKSLKIDSLILDPLIVKLKRLGLISKDEYGRISWSIDLRHIRIIPLKIGYKLEIVYKKVISEELNQKINRLIERFKKESKQSTQDRLMGIDANVNNISIGCLEIDSNSNKIESMIGNHPIMIGMKFVKSINRWYNKEVARLYSIYYKQQGFEGSLSKGQTIILGKKLKKLIQNRDNLMKDFFHKISNFVIKYCYLLKIGVILIDWSNGIKQNINLGDRINQNFAYIPFATNMIKMIKYKARLFGMKVVQNNGAYTSFSSFPDDEPFDWTVKNVKDNGLKPTGFGRIFRGLFRTNKGLEINDDIMSAFNQIRKYRISIGKPIDMSNIKDYIKEGKPLLDKRNGVVDAMLHPVSIRIERLLSEGSIYLIREVM